MLLQGFVRKGITMNELENRDGMFEMREEEPGSCESNTRFAKDGVARQIERMSEILPGGVRRAYLEEGFPLYAVNDKQLDLLGYSFEEFTGATGGKMVGLIYEEDRDRAEEEMKKQLAQNGEYEMMYRVVRRDASVIWVHDTGRRVVTEDGREAVIAGMTDRTKRTEWEMRLKDEAEHDYLTGLHNRRKAVCLLEQQFAKEDGGILFLCDVDNFKSVNDSRGHVMGDAVLVRLATIMRKRAEKAFVVARFGGDEYLMYFTEKEEQAAVGTMRDILNEFATDMDELLPGLCVSLSAGGRVRREGEDFRDLYRKADEALYQAKQKKGDLKVL